VSHPFRVREIASQAGLSEATVDRVLNGRNGVRESTANQVRRAISELERQQTQLQLGGRTFLFDVVMQAPERFSSAVRSALESALPTLRPAVVRARFDFRESGASADIVAALDRIGSTRTHGVLLKAPDVPEVVDAVTRLEGKGIPVVTLVTDLPSSRRVAYVGVDNRAAGATAAYLLQQWLGDRPGSVLVTLSSNNFRGEEEREMGFRAQMRAGEIPRRLVEITETDGIDRTMRALVRRALRRHPDVIAVYSIGGGNQATLDVFAELGRTCAAFVAHDLDHDNTRLLREGRLSAILHHDLHQDMRRAAHVLLQARRALPGGIHSWPSSIQVVTPYNTPAWPGGASDV
jgi:LacI family transcriptional regulator